MIMFVNFISRGGLSYPTRMYGNVLEGILVTISLYYWNKVNSTKSNHNEIIARCFITLNFLVRSTSLIAWPAVFIYRLFMGEKPFVQRFLINIYHAVLSLLVALLVDSSYYGRLTLSSYNFLNFNLLS